MLKFNELLAHEKYMDSNLPHYYCLEQIDERLKQKFKAIELDKALFPELKKDPYYFPEHTTKCYAICDEQVLNNLFNEEEKREIEIFIQTNGKIQFSGDHTNKEEVNFAVSQGSIVYIFFQSEEGKYISNFLSIHGRCERLICEMTVYRGIRPEFCEIGNPMYREYLKSLVIAELI